MVGWGDDCSDLVWPGSVRSDPVRSGPVLYGFVWSGLVCLKWCVVVLFGVVW